MKSFPSRLCRVPALAIVGGVVAVAVSVGACGRSGVSDVPQEAVDGGPENTVDGSRPIETPDSDADAAAEADANADARQATNEYCERTAAANHAVFDKCCTTPADKATIASSVAFVDVARNACNRVYGPSAASGRIIAGPGQTACWSGLDAFAPAAACGSLKVSLRTVVAACSSAYVGTVVGGGACSFPDECQAGLTCNGYVYASGKGITKDGTCGAPAALGQSCVDAVDPRFGGAPECQPGLYCKSGTCVERAPIDAPCLGLTLCIEGAVCRSGVCKRGLGGNGDACGSNTECAHELVCGPDKTCAPPRVAGASCSSSSECEGACENQQCVSRCGSN